LRHAEARGIGGGTGGPHGVHDPLMLSRTVQQHVSRWVQ
jgi:hypothetical protein